MEFRLPELGENIESGDLVKVLVSVGQQIAKDQSVLELETDKATIEVPAPAGGLVKAIHVKEGDKVKVGQLILTVEDGAGVETQKESAKAQTPRAPKPPAVAPEKQTEAPKKPATAPAPQKLTSPPVAEQQTPSEEPPATTAPQGTAESAPPSAAEPETPGGIIPASPSVRRQARELGIDISQVPGSGSGGRISAEDVIAHAREMIRGGGAGQLVAAALPDFAKWGEIERQPMSNIRRKTAEHMAYAWATAPRVTQYDRADITELEELRKRFAKKAEAAGGKLTVTAIAVKVVVSALRAFPQFAASIDVRANEIIYKKYFHIGVAVDTDRGLLVPVIRNADRKNIIELAVELARLAEKARNKKLTPDEMEGGVFTITNLGGIGGTNFSPIVNAPEVAILGISRASLEPVYVDGQLVPRLMLPLSLSYDHRLIDGADAARFLRWVAEALEQPFLLPLEG
ncbi:MAG TPA: 2-oxo acid dehydrogenase subunit E2 [Terriglobia bacterium]|nr:2-oxo acid dehydrogenase subunit E2 [Terriglobia bacterium]